MIIKAVFFSKFKWMDKKVNRKKNSLNSSIYFLIWIQNFKGIFVFLIFKSQSESVLKLENFYLQSSIVPYLAKYEFLS